jgi:hypothetical protein
MSLNEVVSRYGLAVLCDTGRWVQLAGVDTPLALGDCWRVDGYVVASEPVSGVLWLQRGSKPKEVLNDLG